MRRYSITMFLVVVIFLLAQDTPEAAETDTELSAEDQEVIQNLELLQVLDLIEEEDQKFLVNYDAINELEDNTSNSKKDGAQNE